MNSRGLLYSTGYCIQYLLITYNPFSPLQNLPAHRDCYFYCLFSHTLFIPCESTTPGQGSLGSALTHCGHQSLSCVWVFAIPWTVPFQAPLSIEFPRQEYWRELSFLSSADLPDPGIKPEYPALQADSLPSEPPRNASLIILFYMTSCRHWDDCSEFGANWEKERG